MITQLPRKEHLATPLLKIATKLPRRELCAQAPIPTVTLPRQDLLQGMNRAMQRCQEGMNRARPKRTMPLRMLEMKFPAIQAAKIMNRFFSPNRILVKVKTATIMRTPRKSMTALKKMAVKNSHNSLRNRLMLCKLTTTTCPAESRLKWSDLIDLIRS